MRRFLVALTILTVLVMSQNVVAGTPVPAGAGLLGETVEELAAAGPVAAASTPVGPVGGATPEPLTLGLLLAGLSGLAAAGSRSGRQRRPSPA